MQISAVQKEEVLRTVFRRHFLLFTVILCYVAIIWSIPSRQTSEDNIKLVFGAARNMSKMIPQIICVILIWRVFYATYVVKPVDRMKWLKEDILVFVRNRERLISGVLAAVMITVAFATFGRGKSLIPLFNPYSWDYDFMRADQLLHLGFHPYEILFGIFPGKGLLNFLAYNYSFWFSALFFVMYVTCFVRTDSPARMQFLVALVLACAVGGNLMAMIFSSAGPVYFEDLGLGQTYAPLDQLLQDRSGRALRAVFRLQDQLWEMYTMPNSFSVISAFPSMHVTTSTLMAIIAFKYRRWAGIMMTIFAGLIMVGSVMLAWHYAVDGYAGILIAILCWKASGWLILSPIGPFAPGRA
jgi:membrane-associated phospholipid phosphatase